MPKDRGVLHPDHREDPTPPAGGGAGRRAAAREKIYAPSHGRSLSCTTWPALSWQGTGYPAIPGEPDLHPPEKRQDEFCRLPRLGAVPAF